MKISEAGSQANSELSAHVDEALAPHSLNKEYPTNWRRPNLPNYDGKSDPKDHLHNFTLGMEDITNRDYMV